MNLKEIVTNDPFNFEWVAPINSINAIADMSPLAVRKTQTKFQNHKDALICQKTLMEHFGALPERKLHVNILHMPTPSLYWRIREQSKTADNFIYHIEVNPLFSVYYDVWECDDIGELKQTMIGKTMRDNYEAFNYYESLKDEEIMRRIKTLEFYKTRNHSCIYDYIPCDVLNKSIILLKQKYIKDYKPSFKDYAHLI